MENNKSFTLIEIMAAIVIIGILSAFIIAKSQESFYQADIARGKAFSLSILTSLPVNFVSEWKFEGPTTVGSSATSEDVKDTWGASDGTLTGSPIVRSGINCISGNCLEFDGTEKYINVGNADSLKITGDQTIEMWLKPTSFSARRNPYNKAYGGEGTITQETSGGLNYYWGTCGGNCPPYQPFGSVTALSLNKWSHVLITRYISDAVPANRYLKWFINGKKTRTGTPSYSAATASAASLLIGDGYVDPYSGLIDEVRIYNGALSISQVQQNYYAGLNKLFGRKEFDTTEYQQRLGELKSNLSGNE
ncbi:MAG: LamG-like jellyroll fold domain-containing protein [Candidatus Paceibacterota bacterium]|jgi:prepilin-type N-terminal cleavage/methylation domain-containing protein|nr:prepilin-type N-terminal cleavage/methylation domain-containing protein [Candidatus Paceibacterota bacterium]MDD5555472.1 prepilin-type N-terminal cleavage/methylation domain-containing protein [Candidatus Paceibacterota bacterium]